MRRSLLVALVAALAACPPQDDAPEAPTGEAVEEGVGAFFSAMGGRLQECTGRPWEPGDDLVALAAVIATSAADGRIVADLPALQGCTASVTAASCAELLRDVDVFWYCALAALPGNVAVGGDCMDDVECALGYCSFAAGTCPGACTPPAGVDEDCTLAPCGAGLSCTSQATASTRVCKATVTVAPGEPCDALRLCPDGATCLWEGDVLADACAAPRAASEPCYGNPDCAFPLFCASGGEPGGFCLPMVDAGESCLAAMCNTSLDYCDPATERCAPLPLAGLSCTGSGRCARGAYCDATDDLCKPYPVEGQSCAVARWCDGVAFCDTSLAAPTCLPPPGAGESCAVSAYQYGKAACQDGLFCLLDGSYSPSTCAPRVASGGVCEGRSTDECVDGHYCDYAYPSPRTCVPRVGPGAACVSGLECAAGLECIDRICSVESCW